MSNKSKARAITDLLMSDTTKWWAWDEILEGLIPGFMNVPGRIQSEIISAYMTYVPHVYAEMDDRGYFLLRDGIAKMARFKVATDAPEDRPEIYKRIAVMTKRENSFSNKKELRIGNLKDRKILPKNWSSNQLGLLSQ